MKSGYSHQTFAANLAALLRDGFERNAAIMSAASAARKSFFKRFPNGALPNWLAFPKNARLANHYHANGKPVLHDNRYESAEYLGSGQTKSNPVPKGNAQINRILESDATLRVKILRLQNLALRTMASSPRQKEIIAAYKALEAQVKDNPRPSQRTLSQATRLYQGFTGKAPRKLHKIAVPALPETALAIGKVFGIMYTVDATGERFHHEFVGNARPLLLVSSDGQQVFLHGGAYTFTTRGFVDKRK